MLNIEKYKGEIECWYDSESAKQCSKLYCLSKAIKEVYIDRCKDKSITPLEWLCEEYQEPILTDSEREYLKIVFKPFHKRIENIIKAEDGDGESINYMYDDTHSAWLPPFEKGTMYKNMELCKWYTLEELGITYVD